VSHRLSLIFCLSTAAIFAAFPLATNAQTTDAKTPAGSVSGRVTVNEKGAADIVVMALGVERPTQQPAGRATTDASGGYRLTGLPPGQYQITAIAPAMAPAEQTASPYAYYGTGKTVLVAASEDVTEINIKLVRGGVITGRVTDAEGKPVVEERVNLQMLDQNGNQTRPPDSVMTNYQMGQTDDRGVYRYYGLPAGSYRVSVGSDTNGFVSSASHAYYRLTFYPDTNDPAKASIIDLQEGGEATNIDIHLGSAGRTYAAIGRVIDSDTGQPVAGVRIMYGPARPNQPFYGGFVGLPTGPRGEFRLEGLEPGRYGVSVSTTFDTATVYSDPLMFEVNDADVNNLELKANRGLTLSGVVVFEGTRAAELQKQIGTLRLLANVVAPDNSQNRTTSSATLAGDGSFQLRGVRPGKVTLSVAAFMNPSFRGVTTRIERGSVEVTQNLEVNESLSDLRVVATLGSGTIRGTVRFVGGEPPSNVRINLFARRDGAISGGGAMADSRGRFVISNLVAGTYDVMLTVAYASAPGTRPLRPQKQTLIVNDDGETQVDFLVDLNAPQGP
jgi:protocatechuate 3,4-dioxygenase beta subunit